MAAAMRAAFGGNTGGDATQNNGPRILENPTANPTIAAGNAELQRIQKQQAQSVLNAAIQEGQGIDSQLQQVQQESAQPTPIRTAVAGSGGGIQPAFLAPNPIGAATKTADLLKAKAANEAKIRALQAQLMGPVPASVTAPAINTATSSTPLGPSPTQWWAANTPPPLSGM